MGLRLMAARAHSSRVAVEYDYISTWRQQIYVYITYQPAGNTNLSCIHIYLRDHGAEADRAGVVVERVAPLPQQSVGVASADVHARVLQEFFVATAAAAVLAAKFKL